MHECGLFVNMYIYNYDKKKLSKYCCYRQMGKILLIKEKKGQKNRCDRMGKNADERIIGFKNVDKRRKIGQTNADK